MEASITRRYIVKTLPTTETTKILKSKEAGKTFLYGTKKGENRDQRYQHMYICSNDPIKEGDSFINSNCVLECISYSTDSNIITAQFDSLVFNPKESYKIVASTDRSLNVAPISNEFIEEFCTDEGIFDVNVEWSMFPSCKVGCTNDNCNAHNCKFSYYPILNISKIKETYTKEEVIALCKKAFEEVECMTTELWVEQNIK